jgi:hypothetical protein
MPSPNLDEMVTTTLRNRSGKLADNMSKNTALLQRLRSKGKAKPFSGGRTIVHELSYAENQTYKRYSGFEQLDISPSDVFTAAEYSIKQAAVAVTISGLEQIQNSGKEQVIDLLESRIENAEQTFINNLSSDIYSDGTADGGKQVGGLANILTTTGQGTVGGISGATWSFWRNFVSVQSTPAATWSTSLITPAMNKAWINTCRGNDKVDLIIAGNGAFQAYLESLQGIQRIQNAKLADAGYTNLRYMQADVVLDGQVGVGFAGLGGGNPQSEYMYFLNTDYLFYRPYSGRDMVPLNPTRHSTNQDAVVKLLVWAGNLCTNNRFTQALVIPAT